MMLTANILLALLWAALTGSFTLLNVAFGFVAGLAVLAWVGRGRRSGYAHRVVACATLIGFAVYELILANLRVAWYTISNLRDLKPAVLGVPLTEDLSDLEITLLSTLVTLTPGTLTLDLAHDRRRLFVHFMHVNDPDEAIWQIKDGFERRILEVTR